CTFVNELEWSAAPDGGALAEPDPEQPFQLGERLFGVAMMHGGHTQLGRRREVERQVVDEHAGLRFDSDPLGTQRVALGRGLADPDLARDHDAVEQLSEELARVTARPPGVGHEAGAHAGAAGSTDALDHRFVWGGAGGKPLAQTG